jgi:ADP-ribose pyrophosphatase YjhB (NUDIX family)
MDIQLAVRVRGVLRNQEEILFCYHKKQGFYFLPGGTLERGENAVGMFATGISRRMSA